MNVRLKRRQDLRRKREMIAAYQQKHALWMFAMIPTMSEDQWEKYLDWVVSYGSPSSTHTRRWRRRHAT